MLSIGKVGGGQADPTYYLDTVANGREDYYSGRGEAPGTWTGTAAADRGLSGSVDGDDFLQQLSASARDGRSILGYDLTFSAPKSVSVMFGVADDATSRAVRDAHDRAVAQALAYVERHACWTRRGRGGREHVRGGGLVVAMFRHRSSRAGDPQLHTHAVLANATKADGRETALDGRALYAHARTAGYLYQAALRTELVRAVGVRFGVVHNGVAEVQGIEEEVLRHFSQRRQEIKEHMARRGERSMRASRIATLETRRAKEYDVPASRLRDDWRARAAELGLDHAAVRSLADTDRRDAPAPPDVHATAGEMAAPGGITRHASTFDRRDVLRDWAQASRQGADVEILEALADAWLASSHAIRVDTGLDRQHLGGARYSTPEMLRVEADLVSSAVRRQGTEAAAVAEATIDDAVRSRPMLTAEQSTMVRRLTTSGHGVQVVRAAAGTGKTYALAVARDAWERSGVHVHGCALAARAAVELEALAGIDSTTIARLQRDLDEGYALAHGSVLVVDEAGMVGTRAIARLAQACESTDSKLVLVGDDHQLPEIDAGGAFRGLAKRLDAIELREVRRQSHGWDRQALMDLRRGRLRQWAESYRDHGRLVARPTAADTRTQLVDDWWQAAGRRGEDAVMLAHRRVDVAELNANARQRMRDDGRLADAQLVVEGRAFAVGDRVIARRNNARLDVVNGSRGEVVEIDLERQSARVRFQGDAMRDIDAAYLHAGSLEHGYALTAHAAQGATVDRAFVLGSDELYREWGYTALSRHRFEARFYVVSPGSVERALPGLEPEPDPLLDDLVAALGPSHRKDLATDVARRTGSCRQTSTRDDRRLEELAEAADDARARVEELRRERDATGRLRRGRRSTLDRLRAEHEREAERLSALLGPDASAGPPAAHRPQVVLADHAVDVRARVLSMDPDALAVIGPRPSGLAGRAAWVRAAAALVSGHELDLPMPTTAATMDDIGLDL